MHSSSTPFDICIIGHLTKDLIYKDQKLVQQQTGGVAYYSTIAAANLGLKTALLTKLADGDKNLLNSELAKANVAIFLKKSIHTTIFKNSYFSNNTDLRKQAVLSVAEAFTADDISILKSTIFHLGPLTMTDFHPRFIESIAQTGSIISLDVQGLSRKVEGEKVLPSKWENAKKQLQHVHILKADDKEAFLLTGEKNKHKAAQQLAAWGVREVVLTFGSQGSLILKNDTFYKIPVYPASQIIDTTGCGDTYMAAYLYKRLQTENIEEAGRFAALIASKKIAYFGAFKG